MRPHPERWDMLSGIANKPYLARHVECLKVVTTGMPWTHSLPKWEYCFFQDLQEIPQKIEKFEVMAQPRLGIGSTFAKSAELGVVGVSRAHTLQDVEKAYERYRYWVNGEHQIRRMIKNDLTPSVDWCKLLRLRSIDTLEGNDIVQVPARITRSGKNILVDRRVIDACCPYGNRIDTYNLHFAVQSVYESGNCLSRLTLHHAVEMLADTSQLTHFPNLYRMTLARPYRDISHAEEFDQIQMAPWIENLPELHTLELHQSPEDERLINIPRLMAHHNCPNLKVLTLNHILTTATDLSIFLRPHIGALECLTIETPVISPPDWNSMREELFEKVSASCQVHFNSFYKPDMSHGDEEAEIQIWGDTYSHRLERGLRALGDW